MSGKSTYNKEQIFILWLNSNMKLKQFAQVYGLNYDTLKNWSCKDKWKKRKERALQDRTDGYAAGGHDIVNRCAQILLTAYDSLLTYDDYEGDNPLLLKSGPDKGLGNLEKTNQLINVLQNFVDAVRNMYGILDVQTEAQLNMAIERLYMKKQEISGDDGSEVTDNFSQAMTEAVNKIMKDDKKGRKTK